jgi:hypothetical protein
MADPTAPVGAIRTGSTGVDQAGNVWYLGLSGLTFVATMTLPLPQSAPIGQQQSQTPTPAQEELPTE